MPQQKIIYENNKQLIKRLMQKGLCVGSQKNAEKYLNEIGYHKLILGYKRPFMSEKDPKRFAANTDIEDIYKLYSFDKELKELLLKCLCTIEVAIKAQLSDFISCKFGLGPKEYLCSIYYQDIGSHKYEKCKEKIVKTIQKNDTHRCLKHFHVNKIPVPFWALSTVLSFGDITSIYTHMLPLYQSQIAKYWGVSHTFLKSALDVMRMFRNACAHNEVIYDYKTMGFNLRAKEIAALYKMFGIDSFEGKYENGTDNLLAIIFIFKMMLLKEKFKEFMEQYNSIVRDLSKIGNAKALDRIHRILAIPNGINTLINFQMNWR